MVDRHRQQAEATAAADGNAYTYVAADTYAAADTVAAVDCTANRTTGSSAVFRTISNIDDDLENCDSQKN